MHAASLIAATQGTTAPKAGAAGGPASAETPASAAGAPVLATAAAPAAGETIQPALVFGELLAAAVAAVAPTAAAASKPLNLDQSAAPPALLTAAAGSAQVKLGQSVATPFSATPNAHSPRTLPTANADAAAAPSGGELPRLIDTVLTAPSAPSASQNTLEAAAQSGLSEVEIERVALEAGGPVPAVLEFIAPAAEASTIASAVSALDSTSLTTAPIVNIEPQVQAADTSLAALQLEGSTLMSIAPTPAQAINAPASGPAPAAPHAASLNSAMGVSGPTAPLREAALAATAKSTIGSGSLPSDQPGFVAAARAPEGQSPMGGQQAATVGAPAQPGFVAAATAAEEQSPKGGQQAATVGAPAPKSAPERRSQAAASPGARAVASRLFETMTGSQAPSRANADGAPLAPSASEASPAPLVTPPAAATTGAQPTPQLAAAAPLAAELAATAVVSMSGERVAPAAKAEPSAPAGHQPASDQPAGVAPAGVSPIASGGRSGAGGDGGANPQTAQEAPLAVADPLEAVVETPETVAAEPAAAEPARAEPALQAAAPAEARAPVAVRGSPETVANLAAEIAKRMEGRTTRFEMALDPLNLGAVQVSLEIAADGSLSARVACERPEAMSELRGRAAELQRALEQSGFDLSKGGLSFEHGQGRERSGGEGQPRHEGARARAFQDALLAAETADSLPAQPLRLRDRPRAGLDLRI